MSNSKKKSGKKKLKISKTGLPLLESDQDFLSAFDSTQAEPEKSGSKPEVGQIRKNRHGFKILERVEEPVPPEADEEEDFGSLLDEYYKKQQAGGFKKPDPLPLKKRLKRYPPVEVELDLHGCRAIEARLKVQSFIQTCKVQGFFTIRIIVGKGLHSDSGPVLPDVVADVVRELKTQGLVLWHEWEKKRKSKSGAMIVYLKQFDKFD